MKTNKIALITSFAFLLSCGETTPSSESKSKEFNEISNEEGFAEKHEIPKEVEVSSKGEMIKVNVDGGGEANIYKITKDGAKNYLFVVHEWWGLNDHIKNEADRLYEELNLNVIALDLYDSKVATTREKAGEYMQAAKEERLTSIINAVLETLPSDAKIGTIGWCFGGGWSLKTALLAKDKTAACVIYYGMPVDDKEILSTLNSDALFIYADEDKWITPEVAKTFETNMNAVNKKAIVKGFHADHAFANPSSERYNSDAATEANQIALNYLKERMQ